MDAESHEKMVMVGMHRGRSYIPARSIGSKQKRIGVSGTIVAAAVVRVRVGNGGPWRGGPCVGNTRWANGGGKSGGDGVGVSKYPRRP